MRLCRWAKLQRLRMPYMQGLGQLLAPHKVGSNGRVSGWPIYRKRAKGRAKGDNAMKHCSACGKEQPTSAMCKPCRAAYNKAYRASRKGGPVNKGDNIFAYNRQDRHVHYEMDGTTKGCKCVTSGKAYTTTEDLLLWHEQWLVTTKNYGEFCPKEALCEK